jgi:response regulator RpfG family c-di-GMP phosphodiesterase
MSQSKDFQISFDDSPIPLFEEDFSDVKNRLDELRAQGVLDIREYFSAHPGAVNDFVPLMRLVDLNQAALNMFNAHTKDKALEALNRLLAENPRTGIAEEIICISEGKKGFQTETSLLSEKGGRRNILLKWFAAAGHEENLSKVFAIIEDISFLRQTEVELLHNYEMQTAINRLLRISLDDFSLDDVLNKALELLLSIPWLTFKKKGCVFLFDSAQNILLMKAANGLAQPIMVSCGQLPLGRCLCGRAASSREVQFSSSLDERHEISYAGIQPHGHYCVPVVFKEEILGVLNIYVDDGHEHEDNEEAFLIAFSNALAGIIVRTRAFEHIEDAKIRMQKAFEDSIAAMAQAVEARDAVTAGHQLRVAELATAIANDMGMSDDFAHGIHTVARIHDIGKLRIPPEILSKSGPLSDLEFNMIKTHSEVGFNILNIIDSPWPIAETIWQHHERLDGSGYPRGLSGDEISLEARILGVADVMEAMCSHRPYRPACGVDAGLEELTMNQDKLYDRKVVESCVRLFREKGFAFSP